MIQIVRVLFLNIPRDVRIDQVQFLSFLKIMTLKKSVLIQEQRYVHYLTYFYAVKNILFCKNLSKIVTHFTDLIIAGYFFLLRLEIQLQTPHLNYEVK